MAENSSTGILIYGESLCGAKDPFFDSNLTWNTEEPDLTSCFRKTVLMWTPCALFWLGLPFQIRKFFRTQPQYRRTSVSPLTVAKGLFAAFLLLLAIIDLAFWSLRDDVVPVDIVDAVLRLLTFGTVIVVIQSERTRGFRVSPLQFIFFGIFLLLGVPNLYSHVRGYIHDLLPHLLPFVTTILTFVFVLASFICHFFVEPIPTYQTTEVAPSTVEDKKLCPLENASFPSRLAFSWISGFMWTGFKRPLTTEDLWELPPTMRSSTIVPIFRRYWEPKVKAVELYNAALAAASEKNGDVTFNKEDDAVEVEIKSANCPKRKTASTAMTLLKSYGYYCSAGAVLKLFADLLQFASPMILKLIIQFAKGDEEQWKGIFYSFVLLGSTSLQTIILGSYFYVMFTIGIRIKSALTSAVYRKSLTVSSAGKKETTTGEVVNLMSVDVQRIVDLMPYFNMFWSASLQIVLSTFLLWKELGASVLAGLLVMVLLIPVNGLFAMKIKKYQMVQMKEKDKRVKMMNEILQGIKILKLYAWEESFEQLVNNIRACETDVLKKIGYLSAGTSFIWTCAPYLVSLVSFATYILVDPENNILDAEKAFVSISLFNILRFPLSMLPMMIMWMVQASVSIKRIDKYMNSPELQKDVVARSTPEPKSKENGTSENGTAKSQGSNLAISIDTPTDFKWDVADSKACLENITLSVKKGSLVAVVGSVGAGKSSLLSAILGEMFTTSRDKEPAIGLEGSIAYAAQQAWIQNATVRDNILFNKGYDEALYDKVVYSCSLKPDLEILTSGDQTEIGEKGINLSGGQKQRVSLARAAYSNSDIYLLDDPLSAVDSHVGKHIFDHIIGPDGILSGKTRVLVTHSVTYLSQMDEIVVMKDGRITDQGTYKELMDKKGAFADFLVQYLAEVEEEEESMDNSILDDLKGTIGTEELASKIKKRRESERKVSTTSDGSGSSRYNKSVSRESSPKKKVQDNKEAPALNNSKQYDAEKTETGKVGWDVYIYYISAMGYLFTFGYVFFFTANQLFTALSSVWVSIWSDDIGNKTKEETVEDSEHYLCIYGLYGVGQTVTVIFAALFLYTSAVRAARRLHDNMLNNVLKSSMTFFDTTPQGRILNRFSKDVDVLDATMPMILRGWLTCLLGVISTFVLITYSTPIFLLPISVILCGYYLVQKVYVATSRQLKRLESVSRSPIFSHFSETVNGVSTIRAYGMEDQFIRQSELKVDENQKANFPSVISNRWLSVRLETVGNLITFCASLLAVLSRDTLSAGLIGLSVSYALSVTQALNWLIRMTCEVETNIVAVERLREYSNSPQEAAWEVEETKPKDDWPERGNIKIEKYSSRYREGLDLVLKKVSCEIEGGQKVGIVGRTGAGKSSLTLGLFRIVEAAEGRILIDGIDISTLGLHNLRSKLTIIPQDPVLFSGTLRMNLDPFNLHTDEQLWDSLKLAHLETFARGLPEGLEHVVAEGGENLSVGQRQLVCLARALLRKTKVLVLDEATAAVDLETDDLIQATIRKEFKECTVITIAHRLNTILDNTKILVLRQGEIAEFDSPDTLLKDKTSVFYSMCKDAGLV